jgi:hypothetical protein
LEQLTDGSDTTLHDHAGISENTSDRHAESHNAASHSDIAESGAAIDAAVGASHAESHNAASHSDIAESGAAIDAAVGASHTQGTDTTLGTMVGTINMNNNPITGIGSATIADNGDNEGYMGPGNAWGLHHPETAQGGYDAVEITIDDNFQIRNAATLRLQLTTAGSLSLTSGTGITEFSIDDTMGGNSDNAVPTEQAVKAFVEGAVHTQGTDTTLGTMTADINMNSSYQIVNLQAPANSGEALRQTTNVTEADLEDLTDGGDTTLHTHSAYGDMSDLSDDTTPQLGGDLDLNQFSILLDETPNSDHTGNGIIALMQVDVNAYGIGALLHMHTDGHFELTDNDFAADMPCMAIALETGTGMKKVLLQGFMRNDTWVFSTLGQPIYVSSTPGVPSQVVPTSGRFAQRIGIALSNDVMWFNPDYTVIEVA